MWFEKSNNFSLKLKEMLNENIHEQTPGTHKWISFQELTNQFCKLKFSLLIK